MPANSADEQFLYRALELARQGVGLASPNPHVGAVITDAQGNVVGTGTYTYAGVKHAEILALAAAGEKARGATLYINLEPHSHQGRTAPCTDALIAAGIHRVVASMPDPNPKVSGLGFEKLRAAGIEVEVGLFEEEARRLNEAFARYIRHGAPLVTLKSAMTLDGKIAPPPSPSPDRNDETAAVGEFSGTWITGELARAHAHQLRHENDTLLVGIGTVLADNPLLTDRSGRARRRPLLRIILDSRLRLPLASRLVQNAAAEQKNAEQKNAERQDDVLVFCASPDEKKKARLEQLGIRIETIPAVAPDGRLDLPAILQRLGQLKITSLLIEGGSTVNGTVLTSDLVDKLFLYYAPTMFGTGSIPFAAGTGFPGADQTSRITKVRLHHFGDDIAIEGYLRDPYAE
jgi:diaminohydroxyphosphoribosylaminopyrimidine deaminase / 5-amino-6-(5-phosphoribosylamino)uracil reductase